MRTASISAHPSRVVRAVARVPDVMWGTFWEGALIGIVGLFAVAIGHPILFTALGPTAYEMAEKPGLESAKLYNVLVGHAVGIASGFFAVWATGAWHAPIVTGTTAPAMPRIIAAVMAAGVTTLVNILLRSGQPAAIASSLLIALGAFQRPIDAMWIGLGVIIVAAVGEPIRRLRLAAMASTVNDPEM